MKLTPKIEKAIRVAAKAHGEQKRKGGTRDVPYVTHLFSVAALLSEYVGDREDVIVAGLLHDTLEDTAYSAAELEKDFGPEVLSIVKEVTETKLDQSGAKIPWKMRRLQTLKKMEGASAEGLMVKAADQTHNLENVLEDFNKLGPAIWSNYSATLSDMLWYFENSLKILEDRLESSLVGRYKNAVIRARAELKE